MGKQFLINLGLLFCDDKKHPSLNRFMAFGAFVAGIVRFFQGDSLGGGVLVGVAFTGKVTQKIVEK